MVRNQLIIMYHHGIVRCTSSCSKHNFERSESCPLGTRGISADTFSVNRDIKAAMYPQLTSVQFHHHSVTLRVLILYNHAQILNTALYGSSLKLTPRQYIRLHYNRSLQRYSCFVIRNNTIRHVVL